MNEILKERFFKLEQELELAEAEIAKLKAENARLAAALHFVADECDWEKCGDGGDGRIGPACWRTLDGSSTCLHDLLAPTIEALAGMLSGTERTESNKVDFKRAEMELQRLRALCGEGKET